MTNQADVLLELLETHDHTRLSELLDGGWAVSRRVRDKSAVEWLLEMYLRSAQFVACLRLLLDRGGALPEPALRPVLLDDAEGVREAARADAGFVSRRFAMVSSFTPLVGVTALHVAAEYGHASAARALLEAGAVVDARAAEDGHTPLFHTVSSILDYGAPVMHVLLGAGAKTDVQLPSLTWGRGFEWETTLYDVTPISYCQAGLLPQMHRREVDVYRNLAALLAAAGRPAPGLGNVPNRYLAPRARGS